VYAVSAKRAEEVYDLMTREKVYRTLNNHHNSTKIFVFQKRSKQNVHRLPLAKDEDYQKGAYRYLVLSK